MKKIYLLNASDITTTISLSVYDFFKQYNNPLQFVYEDIRMNTISDSIVSFENLFEICVAFRKQKECKNNDFVVLLTDLNNYQNWFSAFDKSNNIFINLNHWEFLLAADKKYPIAYSVIENTLQSLMKLDYSANNNPNIHFTPIGCINDFCGNKTDVLLKLRTGDICHNCIKELKKHQVSIPLIKQSLTILDEIRKQLVFKNILNQEVSIKITPKGEVAIQNSILKLGGYLPKTLFLFFVKHERAIRLEDLANYYNEISSIYLKLRPFGKPESVKNLLLPYHNLNSTFSVNKSRLNKELMKVVNNETLVLQGNRGGTYAIDLKGVKIENSFTY